MTRVFVDSGAWIAISIPGDKYHKAATGFLRSLEPSTRLWTSNYVIAETCTWLRYHDTHRAAVDFYRIVERMAQGQRLSISWVDPEVHREAFGIFERYRDQELSFLDCTSFVLARRATVDFVFGFDKDFYVMDFDLRPGPSA